MGCWPFDRIPSSPLEAAVVVDIVVEERIQAYLTALVAVGKSRKR